MRIFLICIAQFLISSCKAQDNKDLQSDVISFLKIDDKDIQNCQKESGELRKQKREEWLVKNIYDQCISHFEYINFYKDNTLKMLEKTSSGKDFLIINYVSDNLYIPHRTKTILKIDNSYYGLKNYSQYENDKFIEKNEEFEVTNYDIENIQKMNEYLETGKSEYVSDKSGGLVGNNTNWYVIQKSKSKIKMIELFRIK
jgi:hypothetical protein